MCLLNCTAPSSPFFCTACSSYTNQGECVSSCPEQRTFLFQGSCLPACPTAAPYYNDTRTDPQLPSLCATSCQRLGDPKRVFLSTTAPFRCTIEAVAAGESASRSSGASSAEPWVIAAAVVGSLVGLAIVVAVALVMLQRNKKKKTSPIAGFPRQVSSPTTVSADQSFRSEQHSNFFNANEGTIMSSTMLDSSFNGSAFGMAPALSESGAYLDIAAVFDPSATLEPLAPMVDLDVGGEMVESTRV